MQGGSDLRGYYSPLRTPGIGELAEGSLWVGSAAWRILHTVMVGQLIRFGDPSFSNAHCLLGREV